MITAVGFLNRPNIPEIEGMRRLPGPVLAHGALAARTSTSTGKRVAVVGTGCTGYQLIPELALEAEHVVAFQRTPQWLFGVPGYLSPFPPEVDWLDRNLPYHTNFMRLRTLGTGKAFWRLTEIDPDFDDPHAVQRAQQDDARRLARVPREQARDDPELLATMTPDAPAWSARAGDGRHRLQHPRRASSATTSRS